VSQSVKAPAKFRDRLRARYIRFNGRDDHADEFATAGAAATENVEDKMITIDLYYFPSVSAVSAVTKI
jgi:hypothetical protein